MRCTGKVCVCGGSEHALILNPLIKCACQVGVCPIYTCIGPSKQHIPPVDEHHPLPAQVTAEISDSHYVIIHGFRKWFIPSGFFKLSWTVSSDHGPGILSYVQQSARKEAQLWSGCSCSARGAQSLKCTAPQLFPSIGGYLQWIQLQKKVQKRNIKDEEEKKHNR